MIELERRGCEVLRIPVDANGVISSESAGLIDEDTALVSLGLANRGGRHIQHLSDMPSGHGGGRKSSHPMRTAVSPYSLRPLRPADVTC